MIETFKFDRDNKKLQVLDQTLLPQTKKYVDVPDIKGGISAIKDMLVRGAPLIAAVGCLSFITEINQSSFLINNYSSIESFLIFMSTQFDDLKNSRPTAVNLSNALNKLISFATEQKDNNQVESVESLINKLTSFCINAIDGGIALNKRLSDFGALEILKNKDKNVRVLTHCNTGSLATVGYGTALGVIRSLHSKNKIERVYCTETRPYNQGSRLTAWELVQEKIPATLIADNMVAYLIAKTKIDAIIVGADCVTANGDTANKIGTYQISLIAKHFDVPFYVAAPTQSIDLSKKDKGDIEIELRPANELRKIGDTILAPQEIDVWNPCFDITPSDLITGIITEYGVWKPSELSKAMNKIISIKTKDIDNVYALF